MALAVCLPALLHLAGCGYYNRTDAGTSSTSEAASATATSDAPVNLTDTWTLSATGCDVGPDAWSNSVEVIQSENDIEFRFTYYQAEIRLIGLVTGQKVRVERAIEENDGALTWITFEGDYHTNGTIMAGDFTGRDGVTCTLVMMR